MGAVQRRVLVTWPSPRRTGPSAIASAASGTPQQLRALQHQGLDRAARAGGQDLADAGRGPAPGRGSPACSGLRSARSSDRCPRGPAPCPAGRPRGSRACRPRASGERAEREEVLVGGLGRGAGTPTPSPRPGAARRAWSRPRRAAALPMPSRPRRDARRRRACRGAISLYSCRPDVAHPGLVAPRRCGAARRRCASPSRWSTKHVAAGRAAGAHRVGRLQEPDPHLEAEVVGEQRAHRADVGEVARVVVVDGPVLEGARSACGRRGSRTRSCWCR